MAATSTGRSRPWASSIKPSTISGAGAPPEVRLLRRSSPVGCRPHDQIPLLGMMEGRREHSMNPADGLRAQPLLLPSGTGVIGFLGA
jgi:hypothetical protein